MRRHHLPLTGSTQDDARQAIATLKPGDWQVFTADEQNAARGTHHRKWLAPANLNIYVTFLFTFLKDQHSSLMNLPQVSAFSVIELLEGLGFYPQLKWVNDLLLNHKKFGGVLCESEACPQFKDYLAVRVGIGLNVNMPAQLLADINQPVTSLLIEGGRELDREKVLNLLAVKFKAHIELLSEQGFKPYYEKISSRMAFVGEQVQIHDYLTGTVHRGIVLGLNSEGKLLLDDGSQVMELINGSIIPSMRSLK